MGCWNETCMLSHLQIMHGDTVKLIILVNNNRDANKFTRVYYNESYVPLILPIDATYNDYGGVENEKVPSYTDRLLRSMTFENGDGTEYEYDNMQDFVNDINEGTGIYLKTMIGKSKLECVFVHAKLYDMLVSQLLTTYGQSLRGASLQLSCGITDKKTLPHFIVRHNCQT